MNEYEVNYEVYDVDTGQTICYFKNEYALNAFIEYEAPGKTNWSIRTYNIRPDIPLVSKSERIKENRDNLIDELLNG